MGNSKEISKKEASIQAYKDLLLDPGWLTESRESMARALGLSSKTLTRYDNEIDWDWVRDERRKRFAASMLNVDSALLKKAESGHVPAIELAYKRFDGYVPKEALEVGAKKDEDLIDAAKAIQRELEGNEGRDLPGASQEAAG